MEKIKDFFKRFYSNKKLFWGVVGGVAALLVILGVVLALVLGGGSEAVGKQLTGCTVTVKTEGGMALEDIGVYVYADAAKTEMVSYTKTNEEGVAAIDAAVPEGSIAVLEGVAAGFVTEESYPITEAATEIVLDIQLLSEMGEITLGGVMFDFTVTDTDGNEYTLSKLLEEKNAVVLNFWYTTCGPCKAEFPYLQEAYDKYSDSIALLALNPYAEDTEEGIKTFRTENSLTLPMAKVDAQWGELINGIAYPTTVIIDRYGMVTLIHVGGIDNAKTFENAFAYFTAEDYVQGVAESITQLPTADDKEAEAGSKENPLVPENLAEFTVEVPAGETVYYNLAGAEGKVLTVTGENVQVTYGALVLEPVDGIIKLMFPAAEEAGEDATTETTEPEEAAPILVAFTNKGTEAQTFSAAVAEEDGSKVKPINMMELGAYTAEILAGNSDGVYYTYIVTESGNFTVTVKDGDNEGAYDISLQNVDTEDAVTLSGNGVADKTAKTTAVSVKVSKGDEVQVLVTAAADENGNINAASVKFTTAITQEAVSNTGSGSSSGGNSGGNSGGGSGSSSGGNSGGGSGSGSANYNGTVVNPDEPIEWAPEVGKSMSFDAEIGAGELVKYNLYKVSGTSLCIYDSDAYVIYNGKTYKPNSSGNVFVWVETRFMQSPIEVQIGNSSGSDQTFKISFYYPQGSYMNPYDMELNKEFTTEVDRGDDQGVYYTYKASKAGTLTINLLSITSGVKCDIVVTSQDTSGGTVQRTLSESADGKSVSIELHAGEEVMIHIGTLPDENFNYPAADIKTKASFA